jgi:ABC-2 type transport system permease protein
MHTLVRTEVLKLRTVRSPWLLLGAVPLLVIAGISGLVISNPGALADPGTQSKALAHVGIAALFTLAFGILAVAGEYRHKTITDSYLTTPGRAPVVGAKLIVYAVFGALAGLAASIAGLGVAAAWWSAKGIPFSWGDSAMWTTTGGGIAGCAAFAAIGVGVGALIRNLVGAIAVALAWVALVEGIVGQLVGGLARWLPFSASQALGAASGKGMVAAQQPLPRWGGAAVLAVYTALFAVAALATSVRRDVA